jgi:short-subunit dehydrogenase
MDLKGQTALVTGASSGLGSCFAKQLAARGVNLIITARRTERLDKLAADLIERHGVQVTGLPLDLSEPNSAKKLFEQTEAAGQPVDILINNAGLASFGPFADTPWETVDNLIRVDIRALTELTHRFVQAMHARNRGYILNVASTVAYVPVPSYAVYAAAKAYVRNFSEALAHELRKTKVRVCCLCPGATRTDFWDAAGHKNLSPLIQAVMSSPERVVEVGLKALFGRRHNVIAGFSNKLIFWMTRFSPRGLIVRIAGALLGKGKP